MATNRIWPIVAGSSFRAVLPANTSRYFPVNGNLFVTSTGTWSQGVIRGSYTATAMFANVGSNLSTGNSTIFLSVNDVDSALKVVIAATTTGTFVDTANSVALVDGDVINYRSTVATGGTVGIQVAGIGMAQTGDIGVNFMMARGANNWITAQRYFPLCGTSVLQTVEDEATMRFQSPATLANMRVFISGNTQSSGTYVFRLRLAGANGLSSLLIGSSQTGFFEDVTNVDPVNAGTNANFSGSGGSGGTLVGQLTQIYVTSTAIRFALSDPQASPQTATMNWPIAGKCSGVTTGSDFIAYILPTSGTIGNLWFKGTYTPSNTMAVIVVKNGADTIVTGSVGGAGSGTRSTVINSASVLSFIAGDTIYLRDSHTATGTVAMLLFSVDFTPDLDTGAGVFDLDRIERRFGRGEGRGYFRGMG